MALVKCPDCGKEISDKAEFCINCGCPVKDASNNLEKIIVPTEGGEPIEDKYQNICPRCGNISLETTCRYCNIKKVNTGTTYEKYKELISVNPGRHFNKTYSWAKELREKYTLNSSQFNQEAYNKEISRSQTAFEEMYGEALKNNNIEIGKMRDVFETDIGNNSSSTDSPRFLIRCPRCGSDSVFSVKLGCSLLWKIGFLNNLQGTCKKCGYKWKYKARTDHLLLTQQEISASLEKNSFLMGVITFICALLSIALSFKPPYMLFMLAFSSLGLIDGIKAKKAPYDGTKSTIGIVLSITAIILLIISLIIKISSQM